MASDTRNWDDEEESIINFVPKSPTSDNFSPLPYPEDSLGLEPKPLAPAQEETRGILFNDLASLAPPPKSAGFPPLPGRIPMGMPPLPTAVYSNSYASARAVVKPLPPAETQLTEPEVAPPAEPEVAPPAEPEVAPPAELEIVAAPPLANEPDTATPVLTKKSGKKTQSLPLASLKGAPSAQLKAASSVVETQPVQVTLPPSESLLIEPEESKIETKSEAHELPEMDDFSISILQKDAPEIEPPLNFPPPPYGNDDYDPPTIMDVPLLHEHEMQRIAEYNPVMQVSGHSPVVVQALELIDPKTESIERAAIMTPDSEHVPEVGMFVVMKTPTARIHQIFRIETAKMELGRSFDASIFIDDRAISMRHAAIRYEKNEEVFDFVLYDLASTNGTFVNGQRVSKSVLNDDDVIEIGESALAFKRVKEFVPKA